MGSCDLGLKNLNTRILGNNKVSVRDLSVAIGKGLDVGVTTALLHSLLPMQLGKRFLHWRHRRSSSRCAHYRGYKRRSSCIIRFNVLCVSAGAKAF